MSGPVSLRICCIAAMAPALTEAATQPARVKLPVSPTGAEPNQLLDTQHLVIERSTGLRSNHIGILSSKDLHQLLNGDHLEGEVSLISGKEDKSKYLAIGGKLLDLCNLVLPQVKEPTESSELGKMNQPIRLFVNGSNKLTVDNEASPVVEGEVSSAVKGSVLLKNASWNDEVGDGDHDTEDSPQVVEIGGGDAPSCQQPRTVHPSPQDISRRQHFMERRAQRLLRRLRRLQIRQTHQYVSSQLGDYVAYHHHNLEAMAQNIKSAQPSPTAPMPGTSSTSDFTPEMLSSEKIKSLSTAALVALVRKLQSVQSPMSLRQRASQVETPATLLRMSKSVRVDSERTADHLIYNLKHMERAFDSDATESSSGGDSGEEGTCEPLSRRLEPSSSIGRTAAWQWSRDRAQVAARWTWLQAQVSDLEYKIRTQSDIYRQLRAAKGSVQLGDGHKSTSCSAAILNNVVINGDGQVTDSGQATPDSTPISNLKRTPNLNGLVEETEVASRCRPLAGYRPRRLYRTEGHYQHSRKAARLSTLSCRCYPPMGGCAMCMGRFNHTLPLDPEMARNEKLSLLDSSLHPVLSFPEDVPLTLVTEPLVKSAPGLQKVAARYMSRSPSDRTNKYRRKYQRSGQNKSKKLKKTAASLLSMKYKSRFTDRAQSPKQNKRRDSSRGLSRAELRKRKKLKLALKRRAASSSRHNSAQTSPRDSPLPSGQKSWLKKKSENNYDIDNIVIPYGIAAPTRVEKLEYKEIITPKWRLNPVENMSADEMSHVARGHDTEIEDLSDEMFASRHVQCEVREKHRYLNFVPTGRKKSGSMRAESGANTPDPFQDVEPQTPPVTPSPLDRRRSSSLSFVRSRAQSVCESRAGTPEPDETRPPVQCWDLRRFPLTESHYQAMLKESKANDIKSVRPRRKSLRPVVEEASSDGIQVIEAVPVPEGALHNSPPVTPMSVSSDELDGDDGLTTDPDWNDISAR